MPILSRAAGALALVALLLLHGCATTLHEGPQFSAAPPPKPDEVLIYLYRGDAPPYYFSPAILFNSVKVVDLPNRGYTHFYAKPGAYTYKTQWSPIAGLPSFEAPLEFAAGQTYYVRMGGSLGFVLKDSPDLRKQKPQKVSRWGQSVETMLPEEGLHDMARLMYVRPAVERLP